MEFHEALKMLSSAIGAAKAQGISLDDERPAQLTDFKGKQREYFRKSVISARVALDRACASLSDLAGESRDNVSIIEQIKGHVGELKENDDLVYLAKKVDGIASLYARIKQPSKEKLFSRLAQFPSEIAEEVQADLAELERCYAAGCYRSAVILCGRILEVSLHRVYFEHTGNDILEKNPGIGLGTLIAKLKDKGVGFDPGLSNQIHLINQVRIHCVHKKTAILHPSRMQTKAIILYTMDVLRKLFGQAK